MNSNLFNYFKKTSRKATFLIILLLIALYIVGGIIHEVLWEKEGFVNEAVFAFLAGYISPQLTKVMIFFSFLGSPYFLITAYALLAIGLLLKKKNLIALNVLLIGITSSLLVYILKNIFRLARPLDPLNEPALNFSFPSGHATSSFIFYGLLIYLIWNDTLPRRFRHVIAILLFFLSVFIGLSRIYLRYHFASDVIAGFAIGYSWLVISIWILRRIEGEK